MTRAKKITYWIATVWLSLGMLSRAIVQLIRVPEGVQSVTHLGYPTYLVTMSGTWKLLGVAAILAPGFLRLKEWAYAGFFFVASSAFVSPSQCAIDSVRYSHPCCFWRRQLYPSISGPRVER